MKVDGISSCSCNWVGMVLLSASAELQSWEVTCGSPWILFILFKLKTRLLILYGPETHTKFDVFISAIQFDQLCAVAADRRGGIPCRLGRHTQQTLTSYMN